MSFKETIEYLDESYGVVGKWIWRLIFYPILGLSFYATTAYLNTHYVSKADFEDYKRQQKGYYEQSEAGRAKMSSEQKQLFEKLADKIDTLLQRDSGTTQQMSDVQRRLNRLEDKVDGLKK